MLKESYFSTLHYENIYAKQSYFIPTQVCVIQSFSQSAPAHVTRPFHIPLSEDVTFLLPISLFQKATYISSERMTDTLLSAPDDIFQTCTGNPDRCVRPFRKMIPCIDAHEPR